MRGYQIKRLHMAVEESTCMVHRKFRHPGKGLTSLKLGANQHPYFCIYHWVPIYHTPGQVHALHVPLLSPCILYGE